MKKTLDEVEAAFNQRGFTLLSKDYSNNKSPLDYLCSNGHQTKISFSMLHQGQGCLDCSGKKKKTIEEVKEIFQARGFTLLSNEYKNAHSFLEYKCINGHNAKISFNSFQNGIGCAECAGLKKKTIEEVRQLFESRNFQLISDVYENSYSLLKYSCLNGHQNKIRFNDLQRGYGCPSCATYGFNPNIPAILYYLRFQYEGNFYYKIGITNRSISERFQSERTDYTIVKETGYLVGKDALSEEKAILKKFSASRYKGKPFLVQGNTELFIKDILQLDDSILKAVKM